MEIWTSISFSIVQEAVDHWVDAIHAEESLATEDHSMVPWSTG